MGKGKIMELFDKIPWSEHLTKMETAKESEIYYSPSNNNSKTYAHLRRYLQAGNSAVNNAVKI